MKSELLVLELTPKEIALILALRNKFRYGEVVVIMKDGQPMRLKKVEIFDDLTLTEKY